ncbi:MAG: phage/plasmid replication protein, II/X family, partial [Minisyncoccia bacterium]
MRDYQNGRPQIMKITPSTGEVHYAAPCHENIRSDSHQVVIKVGGCITVQGSPARSIGLVNNVFGPDEINTCRKAHLRVAQAALPFHMPAVEQWHITRVDVTRNYDLGGLTEVKQALAYLRQTEAGRYKIRTAAESVYWSPGSAMRSGKAYAKGPHLRYQIGKGQAIAT